MPTRLESELADLRAAVAARQAPPPPDPVEWAEDRLGFALDPWQRDLMTADPHRLLLVCPRQSGKSTAVAALAAFQMATQPGIRIAVLSPTMRQSSLLAAKVADVLRHESIASETATRITLANGSTLDSLPGDQPKTVRGATADVLIIDEASRVKSELVTAGLPMVAATDGSVVMLTTPAGATGAFYQFWIDDDEWRRVFVAVDQVTHYDPKTLRMMRRRLGERMFDQEFGGRFLDAPGALFSADAIDALFTDRSVESDPINVTTYEPLF